MEKELILAYFYTRKKMKAITVFVWDSLKVARKESSAVCEKGIRKESGCGKDGGRMWKG